MEIQCESSPKDLVSTCARTAIFWGPGVLLIVLTAPLGWWTRTIGWTAGLVWLGYVCLWNSARCGRVHCAFTGPFFLVMAAVTVLVGVGCLSLGESTWDLLGGTILIGGVVLALAPEFIWGRYWQRAGNERDCGA